MLILLADFIHQLDCKLICAKLLTLPSIEVQGKTQLKHIKYSG